VHCVMSEDTMVGHFLIKLKWDIQ